MKFLSAELQAGMRYMNKAGEEGSGDGMGDSGPSGNKGSEGKGDESNNTPTEAEAKLLKESMARKAKIKDLETTNTELSGKIEELSAVVEKFSGVDLEQYQSLLEQKGKAEEESLKEAGDWEQLQKRMADEHGREKQQIVSAHSEVLTAKDSELAEKDGQINTLLEQINELTVGSAFSGSGYVANKLLPSAAKVRKLYGEHFETDGGKVVAYDKPVGAPERTKLVDGQGKPLAFEEALMRIVDADPDRDTILRSEMKPGARSSTSGDDSSPEQNIGTGINRIMHSLNAQSKK